MKYDKLIFGKDQTEGIVGLEVGDDFVELFTQHSDGSVTSEKRKNRSWLLPNKKLNKNFVKLEGDLHYKFGEQFDSREEAKKFGYLYSKRNNEDIFRIYNAKESTMVKDGFTYFKGLQPLDLSLFSFDIETTGLDENAKDAFIICMSATYRDKTRTVKHFWRYDEYENQAAMLHDFCGIVRYHNPSIILGHNIVQYDFKYISAIADKYAAELKLGRDDSELKWDHPNSKKRFRVDGNRTLEFQNCNIYGREIIDTYFLAQAFDVLRTMDSYGLKQMIKQLGLEDPNRTFYDASQIRFNYKDPVEFEKIIAYCKDDSDDPIKLWDKMGPLFFHMAPMIPKSFQEIILGASGSKLNALMTRAYLQDGHSIPKADEPKKFAGALSWGKPGIYKNVKKVDAVSLYPSIIIEFDVYDSDKDVKAYLLTLVRTFRTNRLKYKKLAQETGLQSWSDMDNASKAILNSFYGFLGAPGLNFNSFECAEFITAKGREILEKSIEWATGKTFKELAPEYYEEEQNDTTEA